MDKNPSRTPALSTTGFVKDAAKVCKIHAHAEMPRKAVSESVAHILSLNERPDNREDDTVGAINEYGVGLAITPPKGYYFQLFGMATLANHGYIFVGPNVIDATTGPFVIQLYKFRDGEDLELPFEAVMMVPQPFFPIHLIPDVPRRQYNQDDSYYEPPAQNQNGHNHGKPTKITKVKNNGFY